MDNLSTLITWEALVGLFWFSVKMGVGAALGWWAYKVCHE